MKIDENIISQARIRPFLYDIVSNIYDTQYTLSFAIDNGIYTKLVLDSNEDLAFFADVLAELANAISPRLDTVRWAQSREWPRMVADYMLRNGYEMSTTQMLDLFSYR